MAIVKSLMFGIFAASACIAQSINISGKVTDTGGTPLPGAIVRLQNAGLSATTAADGSFTLVGILSVKPGQTNQSPRGMEIVTSCNGSLYIKLPGNSTVEIRAYTLQGKSISAIRTTMNAGTHFISLPKLGAGVYLYKVKVGRSVFMIKIPLIDGISHGTVTSVQGSSSNAIAKLAKSAAAFNDAILATNSGYMNYLMRIANSDTSGIEIKVKAGTGLFMSGVQRQIAMKDIPAGTFTMGSDSTADNEAQPPHQVTLSAFKMQETDVTQEQYLAVMETNPSYFDTGTDAPLRPVEQVSWYDAVKYCNALSLLSGLTAVYDTLTWTVDFSKTGYRLPTEAQCEYACRAGSITEYWWGPDTNGMGARTWSFYNSGTTQPVATKLANGYGLYDITGNVWQWCNDWYGAYSAGVATDPIGAATGTDRVLRGGSWYSYYFVYDFFRSAHRTYVNPDRWLNVDGFRVVLPQ